MDLSVKLPVITSDDSSYNEDNASADNSKTNQESREEFISDGVIDLSKHEPDTSHTQSPSHKDKISGGSSAIYVERIIIYDKPVKTPNTSTEINDDIEPTESTSEESIKVPIDKAESSPVNTRLLTEKQIAANQLVVESIKKIKSNIKSKVRHDHLKFSRDNSDDGITKAKQLFHENVSKYVMSLESEKGIYITGATILAMKGLVSYEEYMSNNYTKNIKTDVLEKKFYLTDILGAIRGMTRLKLVLSKDRLPSVTMYKRMKEEDDELMAHGFVFVSDSEDSGSDEDPSEENTAPSSVSLKPVSKNRLQSKKRWSSQSITESPGKKLTPLRETLKEKLTEYKDGSMSTNFQEDPKENTLPEELLQCGTCGITISSLQHLDRHLERCRGTKRKSSGLPDSFKRRRTSHQDGDENSTGNLYVCDTDEGEIIEGWGPTMGAIPPGPTCPKCAFEVPTLYDLPLHQRYHTGKDKITCPVCPFATTSTQAYLIHVEDHST